MAHYTEADLQAVRELKLKRITEYEGARSLQIGDRSVQFGSMAEIEAMEREIERSLYRRRKQTLAVPVKGF